VTALRFVPERSSERSVGAVIGVTAALIVVIATAPHGPGLSPDSAVYLSASQSITDGRGVVSYGGSPLVDFPPGFPMLLAAVELVTGLTPGDATRLINALSLLGIVLISHLLLRRHVGSRGLRLFGLIVVAGGAPVVLVSVFAWSEPLFILLALSLVVLLEDAMDRTEDLRLPALAGTLCSLAFLVRYVGVVALPLGAMCLLKAPRLRSERLFARLALFGVLAAVGPAVWFVHNARVADSLVGTRSVSEGASLSTNIGRLGERVTEWWTPGHLPAALRLTIGACLAGGFWLWVRRHRFTATGLRTPRRSLLPLAGFLALFVATTLAVAATTVIDPLDQRLLAPAYVPTVVLLLAVLDRCEPSSPMTRQAWVVSALAAICAVWVVGSEAQRSGGTVLRSLRGAGYAEPKWRSSQLADALVRARNQGAVYTNLPDFAWIRGIDTRCWPVELTKDPCNTGRPSDVREIRAAMRRGPVYLGRFEGATLRTSPTAERGTCPRVLLLETQKFADGTLYRATPGCQRTEAAPG